MKIQKHKTDFFLLCIFEIDRFQIQDIVGFFVKETSFYCFLQYICQDIQHRMVLCIANELAGLRKTVFQKL